ncbi:MAG TPA: GreA/GreB family elongation factor [Candidatus Saccharimonadales bacterium]|jgi:transcription elongation factor GreA
MNGKAKKKFAALRERYYLSESGFVNLKTKLQDLHKKRTEHLGRMRALKEQQSDNLSIEDSSYIQALSSIQFLEAESQKLEAVLANAEVVKPASKAQRVGLGSRVRLEGAGQHVEYVIVDSIEADPFSGKISDESPLGQQLLGKRLSDNVVINNFKHHNQIKKPLTLRLVSIW